MPHDFPLNQEFLVQPEKRLAKIEQAIRVMNPHAVRGFLQTACDFAPGLSDEALATLVGKCDGPTFALFEERVQARGTSAGLIRIRAIRAAQDKKAAEVVAAAAARADKQKALQAAASANAATERPVAPPFKRFGGL